ncbi:unnamed protein product [Schistocephalus solidus]|uniref:Uncharacterized protein n=1 Tax=Schistocephalus solidus TaxID=70667 RepID=A0A183TFQ7_SCHSO|nr:unnamed protein product [Schistocephalus solidus]
MDWFRQTPPGRLEPGRHPLDREERQDSKTSRLVSSEEKPSQTSLEAEKESPEKKKKLIVGPADKKSQNRLKVHFVAGGRPTSAPATISSTTTRHPYKATETMTTKAPIASATTIKSKQSLIIPAMAEGSQPAAREGGVHGKPQAQIVLNVYQDRYGKLNFELATDQTTRPSQKTEPRDEDDSSHKDDTERENKNAQHIRKAKNEGRSSMPEKQRYLVDKTSFVGEYPPPHGRHPHTHSRRMMIPHQERDHVPPLYSASFPSEYFDGFGRSNPPVPDFTNHQGHVYPHPLDDLFAVAHESHTEEPRLGKDRIHKPESGKEVHGDERDAKKLKSEP